VIAWLLANSGLPTDPVRPPAGGRAPGWQAGLAIAHRSPMASPTRGPTTQRDRMRTPWLSEAEARLLQPPEPARFSAAELEGLPEPAQRHLAQAIAPGTPLATSARLRMRGHIKVGRWLPFRAHQLLNPHHGFVWTARAAGIIAGSDHYLDGAGGQNWKLLGLLTVAHAEGPDVSRSAAGRAGAEAIWLPTTLLPRFGCAGRPDPTAR
jgi:hypothetical protein